MNSFDLHFFKKYIPEGHELMYIIHVHPIAIFSRIFLILGLFVGVPCLLYYHSLRFQNAIPFYYFEIYLFALYIKILYDIFNWYNDVWLVTSEGIISVEWELFNINSDILSHQHIEGLGVERNSFLDIFLKKGDLIVHKVGDESYVLENAINPYKAINIVESLGITPTEPTEDAISEDRFQQILHTLGEVVEKHYNSEKNMKTITEDDEEERRRYIEKIRRKDGSIDLRE